LFIQTSALIRGTTCRQQKIDKQSTISWKHCETGCKLLLFTHKKSHTGFPLVAKVVTLNDLARRNGRYFVLFHQIW